MGQKRSFEAAIREDSDDQEAFNLTVMTWIVNFFAHDIEGHTDNLRVRLISNVRYLQKHFLKALIRLVYHLLHPNAGDIFPVIYGGVLQHVFYSEVFRRFKKNNGDRVSFIRALHMLHQRIDSNYLISVPVMYALDKKSSGDELGRVVELLNKEPTLREIADKVNSNEAPVISDADQVNIFSKLKGNVTSFTHIIDDATHATHYWAVAKATSLTGRENCPYTTEDFLAVVSNEPNYLVSFGNGQFAVPPNMPLKEKAQDELKQCWRQIATSLVNKVHGLSREVRNNLFELVELLDGNNSAYLNGELLSEIFTPLEQTGLVE